MIIALTAADKVPWREDSRLDGTAADILGLRCGHLRSLPLAWRASSHGEFPFQMETPFLPLFGDFPPPPVLIGQPVLQY